MDLSKHELVLSAWNEYRVASEFSKGISEVRRATSRPPSDFIAIELGFGIAEGPSLMATLDAQERATRNHDIVAATERDGRQSEAAMSQGHHELRRRLREIVRGQRRSIGEATGREEADGLIPSSMGARRCR